MSDSFIFYKSFWECVEDLDPGEDATLEEKYEAMKMQLSVIRSFCEYAFEGKEPPRGGLESALFRQAKPQIDANEEKRKNGKKGGRPKTKHDETPEEEKPMVIEDETIGKQKENHRLSTSKPNVNVNVNDNVNDNVNVNDNANENEKGNVKDKTLKRTGAQGTASQMVIDHGFSAPVQTAVLDWLKYKTEKRQGYKETGLKSLLTVIQKRIDEFGEAAVIRCIEDSMAAGWQGIVWDRIKGKPQEKDRYAEIRSWFTEDAG